MTDQALKHNLTAVLMRLMRLRIHRSQTRCWLALMLPAALVCIFLWRSDDRAAGGGWFRVELPIMAVSAVLGLLLSRVLVKVPTLTEVASLIEQKYPELNDVILTAARVMESGVTGSAMMSRLVVRQADELAGQQNWSDAVPRTQEVKWRILSMLSFVLLGVVVMSAGHWSRAVPADISAASENESVADVLAEITSQLVIEPGDVELEQGTALTVVAKFGNRLPLQSSVRFQPQSGAPRIITMSETVDPGVFAARLENIESSGTYEVLFSTAESSADTESTAFQKAGKSSLYQVSTFVRPQLKQLDAVVKPPLWTGRPSEEIKDTHRISVIAGSAVTLKLQLNKPVELAELHAADGTILKLTAQAGQPELVETTVSALQHQTWSLHLNDADGRSNEQDEAMTIRVIPNGRPKLKVTFPGRDTSVSALQEFQVECEAVDDLGLVTAGIEFRLAGGPLQSLPIPLHVPENAAVSGNESEIPAAEESMTSTNEADTALPLRAALVQQIDLEQLSAQPDDLVTYTFFADDFAPDGSTRRTWGDMMFADVRRFEEMFREGQQGGAPEQSESQNGGPPGSADDVLKLQKEIVVATWNTLRDEADRRSTGILPKDVAVLVKSQQLALAKLEEVSQKLGSEPRLLPLVTQAKSTMEESVRQLEGVAQQVADTSLSAALAAQQSTCRILLQMRSAEFEIQQQQQQASGQSQGSERVSQQQLQQLELDPERNRYESEKKAGPKQVMTDTQREQLQLLNQLKDLARRQQMLNERLQQLEAELRTAKTEQERENIRQELKQLRDDQRDMLEDADRVREQMDELQNPLRDPLSDPQEGEQPNDRSKGSRELIEQARENMQQASESLENGQITEALSDGKRAERQIEELRDQLRENSASRFADAMRELRNQVHELEERQQAIASELSGESPADAENQAPTLKSRRDRQRAAQKIQQQSQQLEAITEQAKQVIDQAEQTEPLLSRRLYDTLRETREAKPKEALQAAEMLAGRGLWQQSQQAEEIARRGVQQLADGVQQAADSILGSEAETLKRASAELDTLAQSLDREVREAMGEQNPEQASTASEPTDPSATSSTETVPGLPLSGQAGSRDTAAAERLPIDHPLTGDQFSEWSDRLRDVEEMLPDADMRNRVAQVRDRARAARADFRRHGQNPQWDLVQSQLLGEMRSLQQLITEQLARTESDRSMVPLDREVVPQEFDTLVQRYYELLGQQKNAAERSAE